MVSLFFFFFKQKTAYEMRISDWSSDVCSSDLHQRQHHPVAGAGRLGGQARAVARSAAPGRGPHRDHLLQPQGDRARAEQEPQALGFPDRRDPRRHGTAAARSEEHTSELQSLMRHSYAVFCLKKKNIKYQQQTSIT